MNLYLKSCIYVYNIEKMYKKDKKYVKKCLQMKKYEL